MLFIAFSISFNSLSKKLSIIISKSCSLILSNSAIVLSISSSKAFLNFKYLSKSIYFLGFLNGDKGNRYVTMASFFHVGDVAFFKRHYLIFSLIDLERNIHHLFSFIDGKAIIYMLFYLPFDFLIDPSDKRIWKLYFDLLRCKLHYPH
ncbi:MAG: hypothetical protein PWP31_1217 [Clostridia bacterium]|nr:hypothetical protein [Clostridia bacterium]